VGVGGGEGGKWVEGKKGLPKRFFLSTYFLEGLKFCSRAHI
jgi:hypothetical protein